MCVRMSKNTCKLLGVLRFCKRKVRDKKKAAHMVQHFANYLPMVCQRFANYMLTQALYSIVFRSSPSRAVTTLFISLNTPASFLL